MPLLPEDRLFPADPATRSLARNLYAEVRDLPIVSPHGHTDPRWYAENDNFPDPAQLIVVPDHYVFRMLCSQGVPLEKLGVPRADGGAVETDGRAIWRTTRCSRPPAPTGTRDVPPRRRRVTSPARNPHPAPTPHPNTVKE